MNLREPLLGTGAYGHPYFTNPTGYDYYKTMKDAAAGAVRTGEQGFFHKALGIDSTGTGKEFIPESYSSKIIWQIYEDSWARQLFGTWVVTAGVKENIPKFSTGLTEASGVSSPVDALPTELTAAEAIAKATIASTEVEIELKTLTISLQVQNKWFAYNVNPQIEGELRAEIAGRMIEQEENLLINGDTTLTSGGADNINYTYNSTSHRNGVNTATGDNEHLLLFNGIRKSATGTAVDAGTAAFAASHFRNAIKNLGVFATKGRDKLAYFVSPDLYSAMLGWEEIETMEKYGAGATIVKGEVFRIYNIRVVLTDKMPNSTTTGGTNGTLTDSTGTRAASGNSYTEFLLLYIQTVIIGVPSKPERTFNIYKDDISERKYDRTMLYAIEDYGFAFKWTEAIVRGIGGTA